MNYCDLSIDYGRSMRNVADFDMKIVYVICFIVGFCFILLEPRMVMLGHAGFSMMNTVCSSSILDFS